MRRWLIEMLGGHVELPREKTFDEWTQELRDIPLTQRQILLSLAVKRMFSTVGPDDILQRNGTFVWQGRPLTEEQVRLLKAETLQFSQSFFWQTLKQELRYHAYRRAIVESPGEMGLLAGKMLLFYIDMVETFIKKVLK